MEHGKTITSSNLLDWTTSEIYTKCSFFTKKPRTLVVFVISRFWGQRLADSIRLKLGQFAATCSSPHLWQASLFLRLEVARFFHETLVAAADIHSQWFFRNVRLKSVCNNFFFDEWFYRFLVIAEPISSHDQWWHEQLMRKHSCFSWLVSSGGRVW